MPLPASPPPTRELGAPGIASWAGYIDNGETTPELMFPASALVYDRMRRDSQVDAVLKAADLPIRSLRRRIGHPGDGVDDRVRQFVADELGVELTRAGVARRRRRGGIVFGDLLRHALLARPFGFMPFERTYEVAPPAAGQDGLGLPRQVAHVRVSPRMPRTVTGIDVHRDGRLKAVRQYVPAINLDTIPGEVTLDDDRLVMYVNDLEGGDWTGRSILRSSYPHWLLKDALMRLGPMVAERNGMGVPVVHYPPEGDRELALAIARGFRAGEDAGAALPEGYAIELLGVTGSLYDELPLLKYHDESIGRSALAMFLNLGHDNGARSLGDTFVDYFLLAETAAVRDVEDTTTEHIIRDLVELNYGPDEPYPALEFDELTADAQPTAEALKALVDSRLLTADPDLEAELRRRYRLPAQAATPTPAGPAGPAPADPATSTPTATELPATAAGPDGIDPAELLALVNAAASLIRSGFAPDAALIAVGLDPIDHLGLLPVTVQRPEQPVAGLSAAPTALDVARAMADTGTAPTPANLAARAAAIAQRAAELAAGDDA